MTDETRADFPAALPEMPQLPLLRPEASFLLAYAVDAVTEVLEWANDGVGADPAACAWLAELRMAGLLGMPVTDSAPPQLSRPIDAEARAALQAGLVTASSMAAVFPHLAAALLVDRMGTRSHPLTAAELPHDELDGSHWLRALPLALIVHIDPTTIHSLALETVAIDVRDHETQHRTAARLARLASALRVNTADDVVTSATLIAALATELARGEAEKALAGLPTETGVGPEALAELVRVAVPTLLAEDRDEHARRVESDLLEPAISRFLTVLGPAAS